MKLAVLGTGRIGRLHAGLLAELGEADLLLADADSARAADLAAELGARSASPEAAIDEADAVLVATPPETHRSLMLSAIAGSRPVFCEKPLAADLAETIDLARRVAETGARVQVGFQRRFDAGFAAARERMAGGRLGRLHLVRLAAHDPAQPVARALVGGDASRSASGEAALLFRDSSIHDFDLARWLTGQEVVEVSADGSGRDDPRPADARRIETAVVTLRMSGGTLVVLDATLLDARGYDVRAELVGERETVSVGYGPRTPMAAVEAPVSPPLPAADGPGLWVSYLERFRDAYRAELEAFLALARGEAASPCTVDDGLAAMRVAVAATIAYLERRRVALSEIPGGSR